MSSYQKKKMENQYDFCASQAAADFSASSAAPGTLTVPPGFSMPQSRSHPPRIIESSSPFFGTPTQQSGGQVGVRHAAGNISSQQARAMVAAHRTARRANPLTAPSSATAPQPVRVENRVDLTPEQNWRPSGRMRGSLTGQAYTDAFRQFITQSNQSAQPIRPQPNLTAPMTAVSVPPHEQICSPSEPASTNGSPGMGVP